MRYNVAINIVKSSHDELLVKIGCVLYDFILELLVLLDCQSWYFAFANAHDAIIDC